MSAGQVAWGLFAGALLVGGALGGVLILLGGWK